VNEISSTLRIAWGFPMAVVGAGTGAAVVLTFLGPDMRAVLAPPFAIVAIGVFFWLALWRRDGEPPILDMGSIFMLGTLYYATEPLLWYALSGLEFSFLSAARTVRLNPSAQEYAAPAWGYVPFLIAFAWAYLHWRPKKRIPRETGLVTRSSTVAAVLFLFFALHALFLTLRLGTGVDFGAAYETSLYEHDAAYTALPLAARQLVANADRTLYILKAAIAVLLVSRWRAPFWRWVLFAWLAANVVDYALNPGSRFRLVALLLFAALAFVRFVRPIKGRHVALFAAAILIFLIGAGILRGGSGLVTQVGDAVRDDFRVFFTVADEASIHYGGTVEFQSLLRNHTLDPVPWQVYFSEILIFVPQQLLPFDKVDPVQWYIDKSGDPTYWNFGVLTQSILGFGWIEIALRGLALGYVLAAIRGWWLRHPEKLWRNVLYIWLTVFIYNSARNTTFGFVNLILQNFLPLVLAVMIVERLIPRGTRSGSNRERSEPQSVKG
jgi:hypothetical protein